MTFLSGSARWLGLVTILLWGAAALLAQEPSAVYVMTNDPQANAVVIFDRSAEGLLVPGASVSTGGLGTGGEIDPLQSQGSLIVSEDGRWLFEQLRIDLRMLSPYEAGFAKILKAEVPL